MDKVTTSMMHTKRTSVMAKSLPSSSVKQSRESNRSTKTGSQSIKKKKKIKKKSESDSTVNQPLLTARNKITDSQKIYMLSGDTNGKKRVKKLDSPLMTLLDFKSSMNTIVRNSLSTDSTDSNEVSSLDKETTACNVKSPCYKSVTATKKKHNKSHSLNTSNVASALPVNKVEITERTHHYPILKDEELIKQFYGVRMTNNQKGRIRQTLKDIIKGTSYNMLPDVINGKILSILQSKRDLTDSDLRKIRVLYNMLQVAVENCRNREADPSAVELNTKKRKNAGDAADHDTSHDKKIENTKRYVVFLGNLPDDVNKNMITEHFHDLMQYIKDVRIPPRLESKKTSIAYLELNNATAYQMALSKHHTMLANRRINVLYTAHKNSKLSNAEIKSKSAKMAALVKSGQLAGSVGAHRKRNQRRAKMRQAMKKNEQK